MTRAAGSTEAMKPPGSTLSRCRPAAGPPNPSRNHHGTPFSVESTAVRGPSRPPTDAATPAIDCALTATTTKSCSPSSAASSDAVTWAVTVSPVLAGPGDDTRSPRSLMAASVAPRASTDTSASPAAASRAAMTPPMAPAPTTQIRMASCLSRPGPCAKVGA